MLVRLVTPCIHRNKKTVTKRVGEMVEKESAEDKTEAGGGTDSNRKKLVRKIGQKKYKGRMKCEINLGNTRHSLMTLHGWLRQAGEGRGRSQRHGERERRKAFLPPPPFLTTRPLSLKDRFSSSSWREEGGGVTRIPKWKRVFFPPPSERLFPLS